MTFDNLIVVVLQGIQVGMRLAGELRYPSCPSLKLTRMWHPPKLGGFQCYDKVGARFSSVYIRM